MEYVDLDCPRFWQQTWRHESLPILLRSINPPGATIQLELVDALRQNLEWRIRSDQKLRSINNTATYHSSWTRRDPPSRFEFVASEGRISKWAERRMQRDRCQTSPNVFRKIPSAGRPYCFLPIGQPLSLVSRQHCAYISTRAVLLIQVLVQMHAASAGAVYRRRG